MSLFHLLACTGWAWSKQGLKNAHNVILFWKALLDWVTTKSKVKYSREDKHHAVNCLRQFLAMCCRDHLNEGECQAPSVHSQVLPSLFRLWGKQKSHGRVTSTVSSIFSSTALWSSAPLKSLKPTTQQTLTHKRLQQTLLCWISYKKLSWLILWQRCNFCQEGEFILDVSHRTGEIFTDSFCRSLTSKTSTCYFQNITWSLWIAGIKNLGTCWLFYLGKEAVEEIIFNFFLLMRSNKVLFFFTKEASDKQRNLSTCHTKNIQAVL